MSQPRQPSPPHAEFGVRDTYEPLVIHRIQESYLSHSVYINIVHIQLQRFALIGLYQSDQVVGLVQDALSSKNVVGIGLKTGQGSW